MYNNHYDTFMNITIKLLAFSILIFLIKRDSKDFTVKLLKKFIIKLH
jgi:hypothetical protein